jgi:ABC-type nickel/cobalt efflux system permease component RcnA
VNEAKRPTDGDFVDKALFQFDHVLDIVHDRVLRPILLAGRTIAFGLIILFVSIVLVGALLIGLVRFIDIYFFAGREYLSYVSVGAISLVAGLIIWRKRRPVNLRK